MGGELQKRRWPAISPTQSVEVAASYMPGGFRPRARRNPPFALAKQGDEQVGLGWGVTQKWNGSSVGTEALFLGTHIRAGRW